MRSWLLLLGPMLSWSIHFFAGYAASITIYNTGAIRPMVALLTIGCLALNAAILSTARKQIRNSDALAQWLGGGSIALLLLSTVGIIFQSFTLMLT